MEYKIKAELLQAIVNLLQEMPYKVSFQVLNTVMMEITDQDASKKASEASKKASK